MSSPVILTTDFKDLKLFRRGKVRDVYDLGDALLMVSTDRISAFDVVLSCGIPYKGQVLTGLSLFWLNHIKDILPHHLITADTAKFPKQVQPYSEILAGRSMLVRKTEPLPVECIVRGYLSGSGWKEYQKSRSICGLELPAGLEESARLPEPIFTPSTKAEVGHDVNVSLSYIENELGPEVTRRLKEASIAIYRKAGGYALTRGLIIADTKFEFGRYNNEIMLIDEALTPDSSRFWPLDGYVSGRPQPSFDKQFVRDYLESLTWDKTPPAPELPAQVIAKTSQKYLEAYRRLTGKELAVHGVF